MRTKPNTLHAVAFEPEATGRSSVEKRAEPVGDGARQREEGDTAGGGPQGWFFAGALRAAKTTTSVENRAERMGKDTSEGLMPLNRIDGINRDFVLRVNFVNSVQLFSGNSASSVLNDLGRSTA